MPTASLPAIFFPWFFTVFVTRMDLQTRPVAGPDTSVTMRSGFFTSFVLKNAVMVTSRVKMTVRGVVPAHVSPDQPVKVESGLALAASVTDVPVSWRSEQSSPQEIPAGELVMLPLHSSPPPGCTEQEDRPG